MLHLLHPLARATATAVLALSAAAALAEGAQTPGATATPRIDSRQALQEQRIEAGEHKGQLTPREERRLALQQKGISKAEAVAKADGAVTAQERQRLHHLQNKASRDIRRQKHDAQGARPGAATPATAP